MIYHNNGNRQILKQQLSNLCTFVTYSAVTAACLNLPLTLSFSPTHNYYTPSLNVNPTTASPFHSTRSLFSNSISNKSRSILFLRGGASIINDKAKNKQTPIVNMVSTSSIETATATDASSGSDPKLAGLRSKMKDLGIDAFIIPSDDPHLSEYVPTAYMRRKFLSGFGGSAGTAVVTQDKALLWTDTRYFNEASLQLDANHWTLMKQGLPKVPTITKYIADIAAEKYEKSEEAYSVGIDPFVHPASFEKELNQAFEDEAPDDDVIIGTLKTMEDGYNPIDEIWADERPVIPTSQFRVHPIQYSGATVQTKVDKIRDQMKEKKATLVTFSALDDVAYLMNLRAMGDIETCPVGISYATITADEITLFCNEAKVTCDEVKSHLKEANVVVKPYDDIIEYIQNHLKEASKAKVWIDTARSNYALTRIIPSKNLLNSQNPTTPMKACKNEPEMEGMRVAHIRDGAAMAEAIAQIQIKLVKEGLSISEVEVDEIITGYRAQQPEFQEVSFPTIAGVGANGAIIHYRAEEDSELLKYLTTKEPILIDSGGQYLCGTTDVTRTWHFGEATPEFKENYTRVLKGNIGVDSMIFPENTPGFVLDVFARKALWEAGKDYGHGTGHGVGAYLNVHEGPHSISPRWGNKEVLKKGMVVSNEPGFYEDGVSGIRIENLLEISYVKHEHNDAYDKDLKEGDEGYPELEPGRKKFLCMKKLTMIPIQKNLIDMSLMTEQELDWLDAYHEEVFEKVSPLLDEDSEGLKWLTNACKKINRD